MGKKKSMASRQIILKACYFNYHVLYCEYDFLVVQMVKYLPAMWETVNIGTYILTSSSYVLSFSILQCDLLLFLVVCVNV